MENTKKEAYLKIEDNGYFIKKKFEEWIKKTKLYLINDCYKLMLNKGRKQHELADLYFYDDKIKVNVDESYFKTVRKIFDDFSKETEIHVVIKINLGTEPYY